MKTLDIKNITIKYLYGAMAIRDFSLQASAGEIVTIVGGTESGKTSLLKCIAGLIPAGTGSVFINGNDMSQASSKERNVCLVYEDGGFFENCSAQYNIEYPLKIRKINAAERTVAVNETCQRFDFDIGKLKTKARALSPEDRFMLSLCRASNRQAAVFLIDDPLKNVAFREKYFGVLKSFMQEKAKTSVVVYSTSSGEECKDINGQSVVLNYGISLQNGDIASILEKPREIGVIKLFFPEAELSEGKIIADDKGLAFACIDGAEPIDKNKLLSDIFIDKPCIAYRKEGRLFLYDARSEKLIYFN